MIIWIVLGVLALLVLIAIHDVFISKNTIIHNFPIIGHIRYLLQELGPELRQYIVADNDEERPFSRDQRNWIDWSSRGVNNYFGYGTDNDLEQENNYVIIKHSAFPLNEPVKGDPDYDSMYEIPCAKIIGKTRNRKKAFRPQSIINISAMSYGSLSSKAVESINKGVKIAGCLQNTGEGGISPHHLNGGELIQQIGTGYFGCRDEKGNFNMDKLLDTIQGKPVKAIEIKLSQGAKPAKGGILPQSKITKEISEIRGIPRDRDCVSPSSHREFNDVDSLLDFVEKIADATGLPVGIKSAVGELQFWEDLAGIMATEERGVDFITIDGGEGGTGAAPLAFSDHVSLPFKIGMSRIYKIFNQKNLTDQVVFIGSGRLGFPEISLVAFALGCDMVNVAREAMLSIGCIQAQKCQTGFCPSGVATQKKWLVNGINPRYKSAMLANYVVTLRREILQLSRACGVPHPALVSGDHIEILDGNYNGTPVKQLFGYEKNWGMPSPEQHKDIFLLMQNISK